jgi:hypothetical protein
LPNPNLNPNRGKLRLVSNFWAILEKKRSCIVYCNINGVDWIMSLLFNFVDDIDYKPWLW